MFNVHPLPVQMLLSVIIPTCHRNDLLAKCLDCLAPDRQAFGDDYEVIVTDDGSNSTAEQMMREQYPWVRWVAGPRKGPAANRNNGATHALADWLVFVDDDCLPDPGLLAGYATANGAEQGFNVLEGRTYADRPRRSLAETSPTNEAGGYLWSCNFAIRKSLFEKMTGFDERFPYACMEDVDFRARLLQMDERFSFVAAASVCHPWRPCHFPKEFSQYKKSLEIYLMLHPESWKEKGGRFHCIAGLRTLAKFTFGAALQYRGAGFLRSLRHDVFTIGLGLRLMFRKKNRLS